MSANQIISTDKLSLTPYFSTAFALQLCIMFFSLCPNYTLLKENALLYKYVYVYVYVLLKLIYTDF